MSSNVIRFAEDRGSTVVEKTFSHAHTARYKCWDSGFRNEGFAASLVPGIPPRLISTKRVPGGESAILEFVEGKILAPEQISGTLAGEVGSVLARIHSVSSSKWGSLDGEYSFPTYRESVRSRVDSCVDLLRGIDVTLSRRLESWFSVQLAGVSREPRHPRLVHGDFGASNLLHCASGVRVLDWEFARWGDPVEDLAKIFLGVRIHEPNAVVASPGALAELMRSWVRQVASPVWAVSYLEVFRAYYLACLGVFFDAPGVGNPWFDELCTRMAT